jgi:hypothetical protein
MRHVEMSCCDIKIICYDNIKTLSRSYHVEVGVADPDVFCPDPDPTVQI